MTHVYCLADLLGVPGAGALADAGLALAGPADGCRARVERIVAASDVVKASDEDLAWLYPGAEVTEVAQRRPPGPNSPRRGVDKSRPEPSKLRPHKAPALMCVNIGAV